MMAAVHHVISGAGLRKYQTTWFLCWTECTIFFSRPPLFDGLETRKTSACGAVLSNQKYMCPHLWLKKLKLRRG